MPANSKELVIPDAAKSSSEAVEFIRTWKVGNNMHLSLNYAAWQKPAMWGIILADILRHFTRACEQSHGWPREEIEKQVLWAFNAEIGNPTDSPRGGLVSGGG